MQSLQHFRQANKQSKATSESAQQQKVFPAGNSNIDVDETEKNSVSTQPATTQVNSTSRDKKQPVASSRYEDMKKAILEEETEKSEVSSAFYLKS